MTSQSPGVRECMQPGAADISKFHDGPTRLRCSVSCPVTPMHRWSDDFLQPHDLLGCRTFFKKIRINHDWSTLSSIKS